MKKESTYNQTLAAGHLRVLLDPAARKQCLRDLTRLIRSKKLKFDAIAVSGLSGVLAGQPLAISMRKRLVVVRKVGDICASSYRVEGRGSGGLTGCEPMRCRIVIIDDLIDRGETLRHILAHLPHLQNHVVAIFLYNSYDDVKEDFEYDSKKIPVYRLLL